MVIQSKCILTAPDKNNKIIVEMEFLEKLLRDSKIAGKNICVISIAGSFRQGKSFMLNLFLMFLRWKQFEQNGQKHSNNVDWLQWAFPASGNNGSDQQQHAGFHFSGGMNRVTEGIHLWPEPFLLTDRHGKELVVLLMDTQGLFDDKTRPVGNAMIFAISSLLSTVQIFNCKELMNSELLKMLELFIAYAKLLSVHSTAFQHLFFLFRDWACGDFEFGLDGGRAYLDQEVLAGENWKDVAKDIMSTFESVNCFLMAKPDSKGAIVRPKQKGPGKITVEDFGKRFEGHVREFVPNIFEKCLASKRINGRDVTCSDWITYLHRYAKLFQSGEMPLPSSIVDATAESEHILAMHEAEQFYKGNMDKDSANAVYTELQLKMKHEKCVEETIRKYKSAKKMVVNKEREAYYLDDLKNALKKYFVYYEQSNRLQIEARNLQEKLDAARSAEKNAEQKLSFEKAKLEDLQREQRELEERIAREAREHAERIRRKQLEKQEEERQMAEARERQQREQARLEELRRERARQERVAAEAERARVKVLEEAARKQRELAEQQRRMQEEEERQRELQRQIRRERESGTCMIL